MRWLLAGLLAATVFAPRFGQAASTWWKFDQPANRLAPASGAGSLAYFDPDATGWGPVASTFGKASSLGLPSMTGGDPDVMAFPACTSRQGYRLTHASPPNGPLGESGGTKVSNYTLVMDVLYPASSDNRWRALYQTAGSNTDDAEFYVQAAPSGGIGIINVYNGAIRPNTWHRVAIVMQAAPGEGKCQRFIDGRFVGGIGSTGSALDTRWALDPALLLFTDDDGETAPGFVSSVYFVDRAMKMEEIEALGGAHASGTTTPGSPAPPLTPPMPRRVGTIGHRGGFFCCTPDNTMAAVRRAISNNVPVIEIDTRLSADGVAVLMHDATVDRTTDGTGTVLSKTVAQLKQLDAGSSFSPEFAGERIPTVAEVMTEAKERMILYFDLKVPGQINAITNALAQTGFNPDDCWFWTYNSASDAASIRARLPNAKIIYEPSGSWASDPNYFSNLRNIGVWGFDAGVYYGTVNPAFVRAAKAQGFMVSIYTILDPDTMVRNAAAGVDFMETDFPHIMNQLQPPQLSAASGPIPANGATGVSADATLMWITGSNATAHRVYLGTDSKPEFLRQQSSDIVPLTNLLAGVQYFWRVDEVTPAGTVTGAVWNFSVATTPVAATATYEWTFDSGDLSVGLGNGLMSYADGATAGLTSFGTTGGTVPHIGGQPATFLRAPAFTGLNNGFHLTFNESGPNGNGAYINRFTFVADVLVPGTLNWTALFNTNPENANDADFYIRADGSIGTAPGYSTAGAVTANTWQRIGFVADLTANSLAYYVNGTQVRQVTSSGLLDGRWSLYSRNDPGPDLLLFNEGDSSGVFTHEVYAASIAFTDRVMSAAEMSGLGGPNAEGIFVRRLRVSRNGPDVVLAWTGAPNLRLQRTSSLSSSIWQDVPGTLGASSFTEPVPTGNAYYRLLRQ